MQISQNRRTFLTGLSALGAAGAFNVSKAFAEEPPIETTTVRMIDVPGSICTASQYVAEELLHEEGFKDIRQVYAGPDDSTVSMFKNDQIDFSFDVAVKLAMGVDAGASMKALSGIHVGCYVLFAREGIKTIFDLKGRSVGIGPALGSDPHVFISAMASYVGLDPRTDINWVISDVTPLQLFQEGKIDALMAFPPEAQELIQKRIGNVILNSLLDKPWSQYFCCMMIGSPSYVQNYPIATKRFLRAILKAGDICSSDPERVTRLLIDRGYARPEQHDYAREALTQIPFRAWRDHDPEDTIRFFALRLHEAGLIKSNPQTIIAKGTDWSFLNEVKRELKA